MSTKTSHRRRARQHRNLVAFFAGDHGAIMLVDTSVVSAERICRGTCNGQGCEECHDIDNCVEGTHRYGDLLLCADCRDKHPATQPWRIDPESGEYVDTVTGRVL